MKGATRRMFVVALGLLAALVMFYPVPSSELSEPGNLATSQHPSQASRFYR